MPETTDTHKVALIDGLNNILQRKANDIFTYVAESFPYVPRGDEHIMPVFQRLVPIDQDNAESLAAAIRMLDGLPSPGCWDLGVSDLNYLNIRFVGGELIKQLEHSIELLNGIMPQAEEFPRIKAIVFSVLDDTRYEIEQIKKALERDPEGPEVLREVGGIVYPGGGEKKQELKPIAAPDPEAADAPPPES